MLHVYEEAESPHYQFLGSYHCSCHSKSALNAYQRAELEAGELVADELETAGSNLRIVS